MASAFDFNTAARSVAPASPQETERRLDALRATLKARAPDLVREIFPAARIGGNQARIGDAKGSQGESMCIELAGDRAGLWTDHATGEGGDLIDLWCIGEGYDHKGPGFMLAVADLEQHLGLANHAPRSLGKVARVASERAKLPRAPVATEVSRQTYVYTSADGLKVLAQVVRKTLSDGDKTFLQRNAAGEWKSPEVRPLYNLPGIVNEPVAVLIEGEKCADALKALGVPATTLMGGSNTLLEKADLEPLRGKTILTWADNDDAGKSFMVLLGARLRGMGCDVRPVEIPADAPVKVKGSKAGAWDVVDAIAEGRDVRAMLAQALAAPVPMTQPGQLVAVPSRALRFLSIDQMFEAKPPRWLIKGILPEASFAGIIGPPASLKSFLALDFGLSIAHGRPWQGRAVHQGPVVYVAGEGQAGVAPRLRGWLQAKDGQRAAPFVTVPQSVAMPTGDLDELLTGIAAMPAPPVLIILDTLARNFGTGDENSSTDMGAFVTACDRLREATGACVLVVHHTGKDVAKGARGSSALTGAVDCLIAVERTPDQVTVMNKPPYGKQKDAAEFDDIVLSKAEIVLDGVFDEDGDPMTTVVLIAATPLMVSDNAPPKPAGRPAKQQEAVLAVLQEADTRGMPGLGMSAFKDRPEIDTKGLAAVLRVLVERGLVMATENAAGNPIWSVVDT